MNNWDYLKHYTCYFIPVPNCRHSLGTLQTGLSYNQGGEQIRKVSFSHIISSLLSSISSLQFHPQLCSRLLTCCGLSSLTPFPANLLERPAFLPFCESLQHLVQSIPFLNVSSQHLGTFSPGIPSDPIRILQEFRTRQTQLPHILGN